MKDRVYLITFALLFCLLIASCVFIACGGAVADTGTPQYGLTYPHGHTGPTDGGTLGLVGAKYGFTMGGNLTGSTFSAATFTPRYNDNVVGGLVTLSTNTTVIIPSGYSFIDCSCSSSLMGTAATVLKVLTTFTKNGSIIYESEMANDVAVATGNQQWMISTVAMQAVSTGDKISFMVQTDASANAVAIGGYCTFRLYL
jgi:hypothetical protein